MKFKVLDKVKMNLKNVGLLMSGAFLIILILAFLGVDMSQPVPYGGVILCCIVTLSAIRKWISSLNKKENENKYQSKKKHLFIINDNRCFKLYRLYSEYNPGRKFN